MIFIRDGLKTLINRESESIDDIRVSQKYNSQFPKNNSFSFLGSLFGRNQSVYRIFLTQEGCKDEEEKFQRAMREDDDWQVY